MSLSNESPNGREILFWTINVSKNETAKEEKYEQTNKKQKTMIHHLINPEALKRIKNLWRFTRCVRNKKLHHERWNLPKGPMKYDLSINLKLLQTC